MKSLLTLLILVQFINLSFTDVDLTKYYKEFVKKHEYELEVHKVTTDDGYILALWHLKPKTSTSKVAYFQHGLADTAWCFFQLGSKSLPFLLAKEGFDIWLGNSRGNIFSNKHKTKNPDNIKSGFYDYTMDDMVKYDLPATFKYIHGKTGGKKLSYIAHSQGSTLFFMSYMHNPSLVESYVDHFASIGTVPNIAHAAFGPLKIIDTLYGVLEFFQFAKNLNLSNEQRLKIANFCSVLPFACKKIFDIGASIKPTERIDYRKIYNFLYYYPGGVNEMNILHWSQIHTEKKLVYYNPNYETEHSAKAYNTKNLKKWKIKALVARTDMDTFSSYEDVTELYNTVQDKSFMKILDLKNYGHLDVLAADSAYQDVFKPIVKFLKN